MIPKIIHYCWLSGDPISKNLQKCMDSWHMLLPNYQFMLWTLDRFDINSCVWVKEAFEKKKYAFAADYIRLYAVYHMGGIYLDMDMEIKKSFNPLLDADYIFAYEGEPGKGLEAGCFGAEKEDPFIGKCLDYYSGRHFIRSNGSFDTLPLPQIMNVTLKENKFSYQIFSSIYFTAKSYDTGKIYADDETFCIHHFSGSWKTQAEKKWLQRQYRVISRFGEVKGTRIFRIYSFPHRILEKMKQKGFIDTLKYAYERLESNFGDKR